ncbi:MAG: hypothetical protein AB7P69_20835 [Candidatus Binatia bacterium]
MRTHQSVVTVKTVAEACRQCGSDQERERAHRVGLFMVGKERGICQCFLLQRESKRYGSTPCVEQGKSIKMNVRRKGVGRLVLRHLQGAGILGAGGFVGTGFYARLARMRHHTADAERRGQHHCPQGGYKSEESRHKKQL